MCGIAGLYSINKWFTNDNIIGILKLMKHRGPNGFGLIYGDLGNGEYETIKNMDVNKIENVNLGLKPNLALLHTRLSTQDLSDSGLQPMSFKQDKIDIIFNGMIYNFRELRLELEHSGHQFSSNTDTEVILSAYKQWGIRCVEKFNGMFWLILILDELFSGFNYL